MKCLLLLTDFEVYGDFCEANGSLYSRVSTLNNDVAIFLIAGRAVDGGGRTVTH